ncbi:MAG: DnaJ domain-containing protein [Alphaproteobacteria bacterium]|nr:J domain-containing protein [Rhodobiaceae bacterium]
MFMNNAGINLKMRPSPKYFNNLRIKPKNLSKKRPCDYGGCNEHGEFQAKTKSAAKFFYCLNHIKEFNKNYNFFEGMSEEEIIDYQISAIIGHRPTWKSGTNPHANYFSKFAKNDGSAFDDPFDLFEKDKTSKYERQSKIKKGKISEKAYKLLDFSSLSSKSDIRKKFKEVVKSLHPDTNGGDNSQEDLLKEVISAYKTLKSQGHC